MSYVRVLRQDELWLGEIKGFEVGETSVLLARTDQGVRAYVDRCPHQGVKLSMGHTEGNILTCSAHRWQFDVATGRGVNPADCRLNSLPVRVQDGWIEVEPEPADLPEVGPVLQKSSLSEPLINALTELNPDARVIDRGSYVRVLARGRCRLTRAAVEARTGRAFLLPQDLEPLMPSFQGRLSITSDEALWEAG